MKVEGLLEDDKSEIYIVADTEKNVGRAFNDGFLTRKTQFNDSEGPRENPGVDAEMENYHLDTGVELCKPKAKPEKVIVESMGGVVALLLHRKKPSFWDGAILKEAETHLPELDARDGIMIAMENIGTS